MASSDAAAAELIKRLLFFLGWHGSASPTSCKVLLNVPQNKIGQHDEYLEGRSRAALRGTLLRSNEGYILFLTSG